MENSDKMRRSNCNINQMSPISEGPERRVLSVILEESRVEESRSQGVVGR